MLGNHVKCSIANDANCRIGNKILGFCSIMVFLILSYFVMYCWYIVRALSQLRSKASSENKLANVVVRLQAWPFCPGRSASQLFQETQGSRAGLRVRPYFQKQIPALVYGPLA